MTLIESAGTPSAIHGAWRSAVDFTLLAAKDFSQRIDLVRITFDGGRRLLAAQLSAGLAADAA
jgi:hypothetical protein